jgi:flagellin
MALSIITNTSAMLAYDAMANNQTQLNTTIAQLSSGKRLVNAAIDPAGLALATEMSGLLGGLNQNISNTTNAQALLQTADGALSNIANTLITMQQLATQAADGSLSSSQLTAINNEYQALFSQINSIAQGAQFNNIHLLTGGNLTFQVGPQNNANSQLSVALPNVTAAGLLGVTLPTANSLLNSSGASQNVSITAPTNDAVSLGTTAGLTTGAANQVIASAVNGEINTSNAPSSVTIQVTSINNGAKTTGGVLGTDSITFTVSDSNGTTSGPITLSGTNYAIGNVDGLGFDLNVGTAGNTFNVGDKITLTFGVPGTTSDVSTTTDAQHAIQAVTNALATVAGYRSQVGASEQQLSTTAANLQTYTENLSSALSNIQDANIAQTYAQFTKESVLQNAEVQVLRQANAMPQQLLTLFQ